MTVDGPGRPLPMGPWGADPAPAAGGSESGTGVSIDGWNGLACEVGGVSPSIPPTPNDEKPPKQPEGFAFVQVKPRAVCGAYRGCCRGFSRLRSGQFCSSEISRPAAEAGSNNDEKPPKQPGGFAFVQVKPRAVCGAYRRCCRGFSRLRPGQFCSSEISRPVAEAGSNNDEKPPKQPGGFAFVQVKPRAVCGAFRGGCRGFSRLLLSLAQLPDANSFSAAPNSATSASGSGTTPASAATPTCTRPS